MDLKQLHYFMAIVSEEQITAAAKKLHMAQPPLSHQIKLLESELGVTLFRRGPHHIELTDAGRTMAHRARQLLDLADSTKREVADFQRGIRGTLSIGTVSSSGGVLFSPGLRQFHQEYQDIHFEIHDGNTYQLIELLVNLSRCLLILACRDQLDNTCLHCLKEANLDIKRLGLLGGRAEGKSFRQFGNVCDKFFFSPLAQSQNIVNCRNNGLHPLGGTAAGKAAVIKAMEQILNKLIFF